MDIKSYKETEKYFFYYMSQLKTVIYDLINIKAEYWPNQSGS